VLITESRGCYPSKRYRVNKNWGDRMTNGHRQKKAAPGSRLNPHQRRRVEETNPNVWHAFRSHHQFILALSMPKKRAFGKSFLCIATTTRPL